MWCFVCQILRRGIALQEQAVSSFDCDDWQARDEGTFRIWGGVCQCLIAIATLDLPKRKG
jgi:hypothetical protein